MRSVVYEFASLFATSSFKIPTLHEKIKRCYYSNSLLYYHELIVKEE